MPKERKYFITNYRHAWNEFRKSTDYAAANDVMRSVGIKQPYRDNILQAAFAAAWRATGVKIVQI